MSLILFTSSASTEFFQKTIRPTGNSEEFEISNYLTCTDCKPLLNPTTTLFHFLQTWIPLDIKLRIISGLNRQSFRSIGRSLAALASLVFQTLMKYCFGVIAAILVVKKEVIERDLRRFTCEWL